MLKAKKKKLKFKCQVIPNEKIISMKCPPAKQHKANGHNSRQRVLLSLMFIKRFKSLAGSREQKGLANPVARRGASDLLGMTPGNKITSI